MRTDCDCVVQRISYRVEARGPLRRL